MQHNLSNILVTKDAVDDVLTKRILERTGLTPQIIANANDSLRELGEKNPKDAFDQGKQQLMLTRYKGEWLRACPGTSQHVCCNLWTVNPGEGCPMD